MNDTEKTKIFFEFLKLRDEAISLHNELLNQPEEIKKNLPFKKLSITQANIVYLLANFLSEGVKCLQIGEIAKMEGVNNSTLTQPVVQLAKMGIIRRFQKEDNLKNVYVELTDYGKSLWEKQQSTRQDFLKERFLNNYTAEELLLLKENQETFINIISRLKIISIKNK